MRTLLRSCQATLGCALIFCTTGCATVFYDSAPVEGTNKRLVVGGKEGFSALEPRIWMLENGQYTEVTIVEEDKR